MSDGNDNLESLLASERERVSKLKYLVIKEKKANSAVIAEVESLKLKNLELKALIDSRPNCKFCNHHDDNGGETTDSAGTAEAWDNEVFRDPVAFGGSFTSNKHTMLTNNCEFNDNYHTKTSNGFTQTDADEFFDPSIDLSSLVQFVKPSELLPSNDCWNTKFPEFVTLLRRCQLPLSDWKVIIDVCSEKVGNNLHVSMSNNEEESSRTSNVENFASNLNEISTSEEDCDSRCHLPNEDLSHPTISHLTAIISSYSSFVDGLVEITRRYIYLDDSSINNVINSYSNELSRSDLKAYLDLFLYDIETYFKEHLCGPKSMVSICTQTDMVENGSESSTCEGTNEDNDPRRKEELKRELDSVSQRLVISESAVMSLKQQLQNSTDKMQRMKNLMVKVKLDAAEQQKRLSELQELERVSSKNAEDQTLAEELAKLTDANKELETCLLNLRTELIQSHGSRKLLKEEKDYAVEKLLKLQNEYNAYKIKVQYALRDNQQQNKPDELDAIVNAHDGHDKEVEYLKEYLASVQQKMEESELRAAFSQSELQLLRKELAQQQFVYDELQSEFSVQKQMWEADVKKLSDRQTNTSVKRIEELQKKMEDERTQSEISLKHELQKYQTELSHKVRFWEDKITQLTSENEALSARLRKYEQTYTAKLQYQTIVADHNNDESVKKQSDCRMDGDGADQSLLVPTTTTVTQLNKHNHLGDISNTDTSDPSQQILSSTYSSTNTSDSRVSANRQLNLPTLEQLLSQHAVNVYPPLSPPISVQSNSLELFDKGTALPNQLTGLQSGLDYQKRRVEYLSELLNESESNLARMSDQNKFLKAEIRRMEQSTTQSGTELPNVPLNASKTNIDSQLPILHLKKVMLRIMTLPKKSSERVHLLHTLATFLALDTDEEKCFEAGFAENTSSSSWADYLPLWRS